MRTLEFTRERHGQMLSYWRAGLDRLWVIERYLLMRATKNYITDRIGVMRGIGNSNENHSTGLNHSGNFFTKYLCEKLRVHVTTSARFSSASRRIAPVSLDIYFMSPEIAIFWATKYQTSNNTHQRNEEAKSHGFSAFSCVLLGRDL